MFNKSSGVHAYFRLLSYLRLYWGKFVLGVLATAFASAIAAGFTWFLKPLLNKGFVTPDIHFIKWLPVIIISAYLVLALLSFLGDFFIAWAARHVVMGLQRDLFKKFLQLPDKFFNLQTSGQLIAKLIYNIEQVADASTKAVLTIIKDIFYIIALIFVMLLNSLLLTAIFFLIFPLVSMLAVLIGKKLKTLNLQVQDAVANIADIAEETIEGKNDIHGFDSKEHVTNKFTNATWQECKKQIQVVIINSCGSSITRVIASIAVAISIYLATSPQHLLSAGAFIATIAAMLAVFKPLRNLAEINNILQKGVAGAESIFAILDEDSEIDRGNLNLKNAKGDICYKNVYFNYQHDRKILTDINFTIKAGEHVAIVGHSGSGKSTLVSLLPRFRDCDRGDIFIDGINIKKLSLAALRSQISIVTQNSILFNDTIANNIACGKKIANHDIEKAIKAAYAMEFIADLPQGLDTQVGENGILLSGGQRQRIILARAFLKNAPILILDEATSVLDSKSEQYIKAALAKLMKNKTTLIIAHRLSTIKNADKILVIDRGKIVESGTHKQLLTKAGYYENLYANQFNSA